MITVAALTTLIYYGIGLLFILFVAVSSFTKISTQFSLITQILQAAIVLKATTTPFPVVKRFKDEEFFADPSGAKTKFPLIDDDPSVDLSVIIPAYEEEKRLPVMLDECMEFLESRAKSNPKFTYEVIVVSDGSKDGTVQCAMKYCTKYSTEKFRVLELIQKRGKGGAVRLVSLML